MARVSLSAMRDAEDKKWQAQDDLRTLQRAREIEADKERLARAKKEAQSQMTALSRVSGRKK